MKASKLAIRSVFTFLLVTSAQAGQEVDRLLAEYGKIETVTCQIRRTKEGAAGKIRFLSRVYWTNKGQLHAEGIAPLKRRTIADGQTLWQYVEGDPKGFSRPIKDLSEQMTISLRLVPGTAMEHLLRMKDLAENPLPPTEDYPLRVGLQAKESYVVLSFDAKNRLARIAFYPSAEMTDATGTYEYGDFSEVLPGVWVPFTHLTSYFQNDAGFKETVKVDRFVANQAIAQSLFIPSSFFDKNIDFVDDFAKIFPRNEGTAGVPPETKGD